MSKFKNVMDCLEQLTKVDYTDRSNLHPLMMNVAMAKLIELARLGEGVDRKFGIEAKDMVTGYKGIVTGFSSYITGCNQWLVQPRSKTSDEKPVPNWIDENRLEFFVDGKRLELGIKEEAAPLGADLPAHVK